MAFDPSTAVEDDETESRFDPRTARLAFDPSTARLEEERDAQAKDNQARVEFARTDPRRVDVQQGRRGTMRSGAFPFVAGDRAEPDRSYPLPNDIEPSTAEGGRGGQGGATAREVEAYAGESATRQRLAKSNARDPLLNEDFVANERARYAKLPPEDRLADLTEAAKLTTLSGRAARVILADAQTENARVTPEDERLAGQLRFTDDAPAKRGTAPVKPNFPDVTPSLWDLGEGKSAADIAQRRDVAAGVAEAKPGTVDRINDRREQAYIHENWWKRKGGEDGALTGGIWDYKPYGFLGLDWKTGDIVMSAAKFEPLAIELGAKALAYIGQIGPKNYDDANKGPVYGGFASIGDAAERVGKIFENAKSYEARARGSEVARVIADPNTNWLDVLGHYVRTPELIVEMAVEAGGSMLPVILAAKGASKAAIMLSERALAAAPVSAGVAEAVGGIATKAGVAGGAAMNAAMGAGSVYSKMRDDGASEEQANVAAALTGIGYAVIGKLTGGGLEGSLVRGTALSSARSRGLNVLKEGVQEGAEKATEIVSEDFGLGRATNLNELAKQVVPDVLAGGALGGAVTHGGRNAPAPQTREQQVADAIDAMVAGTDFKQDGYGGVNEFARRAADAEFYNPATIDPQQTVKPRGDEAQPGSTDVTQEVPPSTGQDPATPAQPSIVQEPATTAPPVAVRNLQTDDMPGEVFSTDDIGKLLRAADAEHTAARGGTVQADQVVATTSQPVVEAQSQPILGADESRIGIAKVPQGVLANQAEQVLRDNARGNDNAGISTAPGELAGRGVDGGGADQPGSLGSAGRDAAVTGRGNVNAQATEFGDGTAVPVRVGNATSGALTEAPTNANIQAGAPNATSETSETTAIGTTAALRSDGNGQVASDAGAGVVGSSAGFERLQRSDSQHIANYKATVAADARRVEPTIAALSAKAKGLDEQARQLDIAGTPDARKASLRMQQESAKLITQVTRLRSAAAQSVALAQTVQAADGNPAHEWFAPLAEAAKRQFGRPVVAYLDTSASATDGFAHEGIAYVNLSNPEQAVRATIFHELQHVIRREARLGDGQAQLATRMLDQVWGMIDTKAKQAYAAKYLFRDEVRGGTMSIEQALQDPALQDEMLSDFMGRRGNDDGFWAGVAKKSPATFGAFAQRWIGVAQGLIDVLRGRAQDGSIKNIDVAIANLDRAKAVASRVVQAWADANPALAAKQGLTGLVSSDVRQDSGRVSVDGANESVGVNLSVATGSIPKLADLQQRSNAGDEQATALLHRTARNSVTQLMSGIEGASIKTTAQGGLFGGEMEPSLGVNVEFAAQAKPKVLAALARFAENYNQWQIHVLQETDAPPGTAFPDGSYSTVQWTMALKSPMTRAEVQALVDGSGLPGLTYSDKQLSVYYTGGPNNDAGLAEFSQGWKRAAVLVGDKNAGISATTSRLWPYGNSFAGEPTIGFDAIRGEVGAAPIQDNPITRDFAEEHLGEPVTPAQQAPSITPEQRKLQDGIAKAYEAMPLDDLSNPLVRRAYSELSQEVVAQFDALPIKVEMYGDGAEPYANSQAMRSDVADKNHLFIYPTEAATFGPPGVDYESHPLLEDSGRKDVNGRPMLANDLLRAVHDYFAHTLSPTQFGPSGEEAAWTNHMRTTKSPWAKWALTSETRGQNSWVNFRSGVEDTPISQRSFAVQKVGLLPIQYAMTGDAGADAGVQALRETLTEEQSKGSLAKGSTEYATSASDEGSGTIQKGADTGPEAVDVRLLKGLSVRLEVPGSDGQGESFVTVDAGRVVAAYDERIDNLNQLIKCLGK